MNISDIQKIKLLNNLYRLLYSNGTKPDEREVKEQFNKYFFTNKIGNSLKIPYEDFRDTSVVDPNLLNEIMATSCLNLEVLYDFLNINNEEIYKAVTILNKRINNIKTRRKKIEAKVNELLYANSNSDGFFYSYIENFSSTENIDLNLTSALIDTANSQATIPQITGEVFDSFAPGNLTGTSIKYSILFNGQTVVEPTDVGTTQIQNIFDGLSNTYASFSYASDIIGVVTLTMDISLNPNYGISKVSGRTLGSSPVSIYAGLSPVDKLLPIEEKFKDSSSDYDSFSFNYNGSKYNRLKFIMYKYEPDEIAAGENRPYIYNFGLRDLIISSQYFDKYATIISKPIGIPSNDNTYLFINSVSIDPIYESLEKTDVQFYIAQDVDGATEVSDFSWIPISPYSQTNASYNNTVNFGSENFVYKFIDDSKSSSSLNIIEQSTENHIQNPSTNIYPGLSVYKIAQVPEEQQYISPYITASLNSYRRYVYGYELGLSNNLQKWNSIIQDNLYTGTAAILQDQNMLINPDTWDICSAYLETSIFCKNSSNVLATVFKSSDNFSLCVYLNNVQVANVPVGVNFANVELNFVEGINNLIITYDKSEYGLVNFSPINGRNLSDFGDVYLDYFTYLSPIDFKNITDSNRSFFTIDTINATKYILSTKEIRSRSKIFYYDNIIQQPTSVRFRIDLHRFDNPLTTPVIDSMRVKFKHNE